ncbi:10199_t:CDS:2 [Ambispora gerdemannii]|uniref:10199_t:CDS:1 n=1 Tax=Ambispora gerdemannii TaxID=144530 RepID=A0A9N9GBG4_9GLOM|nr:10199_t:CDS:2 [Ambispora gerdemannii]
MASRLPATCFPEILEYLDFDRNCIFSCMLVNRHWCENSIPYLWRNPFSSTRISFSSLSSLSMSSTTKKNMINIINIINTLVNCLSEQDRMKLRVNNNFNLNKNITKKSSFDYTSFLRCLDLQIFAKALSYSFGGGDMTTIFKCLHLLARKIINDSDAIIWDLKLDIIPSLVINDSDAIIWDLKLDIIPSLVNTTRTQNPFFISRAMKAYSLLMGDDINWNLFKLPGAARSLAGLRKLTLKAGCLEETFPLAKRISPSINELIIVLHSPKDRKTSYDQVNKLVPYLPILSSWRQLKTLAIARGYDHQLLMPAEKFLDSLGTYLPFTVENLTVNGALKFSPESLEMFFALLMTKPTPTTLNTLAFPEMKFFDDKHLLVVGAAAKGGTLKKLDISSARHITSNTLKEMRIYVDTILMSSGQSSQSNPQSGNDIVIGRYRPTYRPDIRDMYHIFNSSELHRNSSNLDNPNSQVDKYIEYKYSHRRSRYISFNPSALVNRVYSRIVGSLVDTSDPSVPTLRSNSIQHPSMRWHVKQHPNTVLHESACDRLWQLELLRVEDSRGELGETFHREGNWGTVPTHAIPIHVR